MNFQLRVPGKPGAITFCQCEDNEDAIEILVAQNVDYIYEHFDLPIILDELLVIQAAYHTLNRIEGNNYYVVFVAPAARPEEVDRMHMIITGE